jgi:hypothetical protein
MSLRWVGYPPPEGGPNAGEAPMIVKFLNLIAEPSLLRRYVGRHRAR